MAGPTESTDNKIWQAWLLAVVGGYADAVGFLTFNAFAGAMTGNTVLFGIALAAGRFTDAAQSASIIAAFLVGVGASILLGRIVSTAGILCLEIVAIVLAALVQPLAAAPLLALAMGLQNAAMTHFAGGTINTVFLTGNLQTFVRSVLRWSKSRTDGHDAVVTIGALWLSYVTGILAGALACRWTVDPLLFAALPLPLVLLRRSMWQREG